MTDRAVKFCGSYFETGKACLAPTTRPFVLVSLCGLRRYDHRLETVFTQSSVLGPQSMFYRLTSTMLAKMKPTPAHWLRSSRSRRNSHEKTTVTAVNSEPSTVTTDT